MVKIYSVLLLLFFYSCISAYDPNHEDYIFNNYFNIPIVIRAVDYDNNQQLIYIPVNEGRVINIIDYLLSNNDNTLSIEKFNNHFKTFEIFTLYNEKIETQHILLDVEYISDSNGYYYNINLQPNK